MKQIYIHGLGQTPDSWKKTIAWLKTDKSCECPDLSKLVYGNEVDYHNLYAAFSDICNQCDEPVDLVGLSLGGVLALNYAIDYPEKVNSLVLIAAQYKMPKTLLRFQNIIFHFMPKSMFLQTGFGKAEFLRLCKSMMALDFSESLEKVICRTLIVCGEKDSANKKASIKLAEFIKNAQLHIIRKAGHELNIEAPKQLAKILDDFYSEAG